MSSAGVTIVALAVVVGVVACGSDDARDTRASDATLNDAGLLAMALSRTLEAIDQRAPPDAFEAPSPGQGNFLFHPRSRVESVELMAVLRAADRTPVSVYRRFDRLALSSGTRASSRAGAASGFRASSVIALSSVTSDPGDSHHRNPVERVALGLASADEQGLQVRDASVSVVTGGGDSSCHANYVHAENVAANASRLSFDQADCVDSRIVAGVASSSSQGLSVSGNTRTSAGMREVEGRGWVRRTWGDLRVTTAAVVFDRLLLELSDLGTIDILRSKRRSGQGPVSATLHRIAGESDALDTLADSAVSWTTIEPLSGSGSDADIPRWRLSDERAMLDVILVPHASIERVVEAVGPVWRGAVTASGTHEGVGFLEIVDVGHGAH